MFFGEKGRFKWRGMNSKIKPWAIKKAAKKPEGVNISLIGHGGEESELTF